MRGRDAGGVLVDVEVHVHVQELRPGDADTRPIERHLVSIALREQVGGDAAEDVGAEGRAALGAGVRRQLELRQGGHDEEVAVVVGHRLFDQRDLQVAVGLGAEQVVAHHGLVEVGRHLGHEQAVAAIDERLRPPRVVRVQRVAQLVRQRAQAEHVVLIRHHDERPRAVGAAGERALALAAVARPIHPALFQAAAAQDIDVLRAQRRHARRDPLDGLRERHGRLGRGQRRLDVVDAQRIQPQRPFAQPPVTVPGGQVRAEGRDEVVEHLHRDVVRLQRAVQRGGVAAHPRGEDVLFNGRGQRGRVGVLERQIAVGVALPRAAAHRAVGVGDQGPDAGLAHLQLRTAGGDRGRELHVRVVQRVVDAERTAERIAGQRQHLLHLAGAHMGLAAAQPIDVVGEESQVGGRRDPALHPVKAQRHELRVEECAGGCEVRHQCAGLAGAGGRGLIAAIHRRFVVGVDHDLAHQHAGGLEAFQEGQQRRRAFGQPAAIGRQRRQLGGQLSARGLPIGRGRVDALQVPGLLDRDFAARG